MYYTIYKITNQVDGKIYIGSHKTKDLNDSYMGSGKYLKHAQEKYGIENFTREILFVFETAEEMYTKEAEIVNEDFIASGNTYNLKVGGYGGFDYINDNPEKFLTEKRLSALMSQEERIRRWKEKWENDPNFKLLQKENSKLGAAATLKKYPNGVFAGRKHNQQTIDKMKKSAIGRGLGTANSQYGTIWITNGTEKKKIKSTEQMPEGWRRGRK